MLPPEQMITETKKAWEQLRQNLVSNNLISEVTNHHPYNIQLVTEINSDTMCGGNWKKKKELGKFFSSYSHWISTSKKVSITWRLELKLAQKTIWTSCLQGKRNWIINYTTLVVIHLILLMLILSIFFSKMNYFL